MDITSRYEGGIPPCAWTMCRGQCEGTGSYPTQDARAGVWASVTCGECDGTGRRVHGAVAVVLEWLYRQVYPLQFAAWVLFKYGPADALDGFRMVWREQHPKETTR